MNEPNDDDLRLMENTPLYKTFARERDEAESERVGVDISAVWQDQEQPGAC